MNKQNAQTSAPWWRHGYVWMVIAGPVLVIVAGIVTVYLALSKPDPLVTPDYYRQGIEINKSLETRSDPGMTPAQQARNHAATGATTAKTESKP